MKAELETITPEKAMSWLEGNKHNRHIRETHVKFLVNEIKSGRWMQNGASIVFNGIELLDGQHRLWAVIESGEPIKSLVVRGVDKDAFSTIDTGRPRTASDVLSINGVKHGNSLSSATRFMIDYQEDSIMNRRRRISNTEIMEYVQANPEIVTSLEFMYSLSKGSRWLLSNGPTAALHCLMAKKDEAMAYKFFNYIRYGKDEHQEAWYYLREKLVAMAQSTVSFRHWHTQSYVIKAWNAGRKGERLKIFKHIAGEKFPKVK